MLRWESSKKNRYYTLMLTFNLFSELEIVRSWGGKQNRMGSTLTEIVSPDLVRNRIREIAKERRSRGYLRTKPT
jgi:hypothetical protein